MKITVLDKNTVTNGDVNIDLINTLGEVDYYDLLPPDEIAGAIGDSEGVICNKAVITGEIMDSCPNLKYIGLFATGYNNIDIKAATAHGITVCNVPGYSTDSVAQTVFSFILHFAVHADEYSESIKNGDWVASEQFTYFRYTTTELAGKTLGIFGLGTIGKKVADIGNAFGMKVIAVSHNPQHYTNVEIVDFDTLLKNSDYLTIHCPLTEYTKEIINRDTLSKMKKSAVLINTARGGCVNENDLAEALNNNVIAGAGIDVLQHEPMTKGHPYLSTKNIVMTPHTAWGTLEARKRLIDIVCLNVRSFQSGKPINVVN